MKRRTFIKSMSAGAMGLLLSGCGLNKQAATREAAPAQPTTRAPLLYEANDNDAPIVYFTKEVSGQSLLKVYEMLGRRALGKVGIKISFESPNGSHLNPQLLKPLRDKTDGTFIDSNGFTPPRNTTEGNLRVAQQHGFTAVGPCDVLDADGDIDMLVTNGYHLKYARTGAHFDNYDSVISVVLFKAHHLPVYGGTMKNMSICLASISGKAILHSAGQNEQSYVNISGTVREQSFADGVQAAMNYKKGRWCFINVLDNFDPDDSCQGTKNLGDIGILASLDPVALDQAAVDMTFGAADTEQRRQQWEEAHNVNILHYAEQLGVGRRHYRLVEVQ